ncbi:hypothetical protein ANO11243_074350 [Dothideomycetidae sp. 11243]|nr:hypothetical protein ANO11243_074350 [fungal sp. No.11243]
MKLSHLLLSLLPLAVAQQYAGDVIPNSLPAVPGAEITYFRVADPAGKNNNLTLTNYASLYNSQRLPPSQVQRVVIIIHGLDRDPGTYMANMLSALAQTSTGNPNVNFSNVQIICPYFTNGDDKNFGYPWTSGLLPGRGSTTNALVWPGSQWSAGGNNQYPYNSTTISSYAAIDQMIQYFDNRALYPNVKQIVVGGHSMGGQFVNRYAEIGIPLITNSPVTYWIANPDSFAWMSTTRPLSTASCSIYDVWREGFTNFTLYPMKYQTSLVASGRSAVLANWNSKSKAFVRGTQDFGDSASTCAPYTTGANRNERFFNFIKAFPPVCTSPSHGQCDTVDYVNAGHDAGAIMVSPAGQARLFLDNWYGDGARAYDFGYPREATGDDPFPDPAMNGTFASGNSNVYAGNKTYAGCWSDNANNIRTLTFMAYDVTNNTIEACTSYCTNAGYSIAGVEYGTQCFCGNAITGYAGQTVDNGCTMPCSGNSSEICGDSNRISLFSNGPPTQYALAGTPEFVGNYGSLFCYTEATTGRALSGISYSDPANMTLESCAAFCNGYPYFGTEYASQCFCGSYLNAGSVIAPTGDCSSPCVGNPSELCGGASRLTVYTLLSGSNVSTISQGAAPTTIVGTGTATASAGAIPTADLCPAANEQTISYANSSSYLVTCSSDSTQGAYTGINAANSYLDCMNICDAAASTGCQGFVYVGQAGGLGGGACWLKTAMGTYNPAATNYIAGYKGVASPSRGTTPTSTTTTAPAAGTTAASIPSASLCPAANGQSVSYANSSAYAITCSSDSAQGSYSEANAVNSYLECLTFCDAAASTGCQGFVYVGQQGGLGAGACWLKTSMGTYSPAANNFIAGAKGSVPATGTTTGGSATTTTTTAAAAPTSSISVASLCPSANGQAISYHNSSLYTVTCSSDSTQGAYNGVNAVTSYLDCMNLCDAAASTGCEGFVYVGQQGGLGGGTCWLKAAMGSLTPAAGNFIAGSKGVTASGSSSSSSAASTATVSAATPTISISCPASNNTVYTALNNETFLIECGVDHAAGDMGSLTTQTFAQCVEACANTQGCIDVSLSGTACYMKSSVGAAVSNNVIWGARLVTGITTSSTTTASTAGSPAAKIIAQATATTTTSTTTATTITTTTSPATTLTTTTKATTTTTTASTALPSGVSTVGCMVDPGNPRSLPVQAYSNTNNTPQQCSLACRALGYKYAGTEYSSECWCGNYAPPTNASSSDCAMSCSGDPHQICGGPNRLSVTLDTTWTQTFFARQTYASWTLMSCYTDSSVRTLATAVSVPGGASNMTSANCLSACAANGFAYCGTEYYQECWGSNALPDATRALPGDPLNLGCNYPCTGNATEACGGANRVLVYVNNGTGVGN